MSKGKSKNGLGTQNKEELSKNELHSFVYIPLLYA
jgi:hypothetical protein